jgi:hypothetical protein
LFVTPSRVAVLDAAARHLDPVQFLFHLMEGIVADLVAGAHREHGLARGVQSPAVNVAMCESSGLALLRIGIHRSQVRDEFLPDRLGDG